MLVFANVPKPDVVYWQYVSFDNVWDCRTYIAENKVNLVDSVLKMYRELVVCLLWLVVIIAVVSQGC